MNVWMRNVSSSATTTRIGSSFQNVDRRRRPALRLSRPPARGRSRRGARRATHPPGGGGGRGSLRARRRRRPSTGSAAGVRSARWAVHRPARRRAGQAVPVDGAGARGPRVRTGARRGGGTSLRMRVWVAALRRGAVSVYPSAGRAASACAPDGGRACPPGDVPGRIARRCGSTDGCSPEPWRLRLGSTGGRPRRDEASEAGDCPCRWWRSGSCPWRLRRRGGMAVATADRVRRGAHGMRARAGHGVDGSRDVGRPFGGGGCGDLRCRTPGFRPPDGRP